MKRRDLLAAAAGALAATTLAGGVAWATIPGSDGTIGLLPQSRRNPEGDRPGEEPEMLRHRGANQLEPERPKRRPRRRW